MALWQFKFYLVSAADARVDGVDAISLSREQAEGAKLRLNPDEQQHFLKDLSGLLPEKASWDAALRIWGDEKTDDIQIWFDGDAIAEAQVRLDMREPAIRLMDALCRLANRYDCVFLTDERLVIRPSTDILGRSSQRSAASDFARDPAGFLARAPLVPIKPE